MAYIKNTWVDQDVERPKTYEVTNNQDGSITLTDSFGLVTELGTPVNAVNMNHIEDGIESNDIRIGDLDDLTTTAKDNLVDAVNEIASLGDKANTDLSNLTVDGKDYVVTLSHELDWDNKVVVSTTSANSNVAFTFPADGLLTVRAHGYGTSSNSKYNYAAIYSDVNTTEIYDENKVALSNNTAATYLYARANYYGLAGESVAYYAYATGWGIANRVTVTFIPFKKS